MWSTVWRTHINQFLFNLLELSFLGNVIPIVQYQLYALCKQPQAVCTPKHVSYELPREVDTLTYQHSCGCDIR